MSETPDLTSPKTPGRKKKTKKKRAATPQAISEDQPGTPTPLPQRDLTGALAATVTQPTTRVGTRASTNPSQAPNQNPPQGTMPANTQANQVTIGGVTIATQATPATDVSGSLVAMKKENRSGLDADKKHAFFQLITKHQHTSFDLQAQTMQSVQDLQENYDLGVGLANVQMHFKRYDVLDVFTIVFPVKDANGEQTCQLETDNNGVTKTVFLFDRHAELTAEQVAESCKWYSRWPDASACPWFRENLSLSYDYFCNHMTPQLWGKVLEDMLPYKDTQGMGGPLVFLLMMKRLQVNSQLVVETIQRQLKTLRIDQYQGESVDDLVSHIRTMLTRLKSLEKRIDGKVVFSHVPHDIGKTLISLFQTSSDPKFNEVFHNKEINAYENALTQGDAAYGTPDTILDLATSIYQNRMASEEGWTGQQHKVNETGFSAQKALGPCFNCGGKHSVQVCPEPLNKDRVAQNKRKFFDSKKTQKDSGKSRRSKNNAGVQFEHLPTPSNRKKNRARVNKKWYYYHFKSKSWKMCDDQTEAVHRPHALLSGAPAPAAAPAPAPAATPPAAQVPGSDASALTAATGTSVIPPHVRQQVTAAAQAMNELITQVNSSS